LTKEENPPFLRGQSPPRGPTTGFRETSLPTGKSTLLLLTVLQNHQLLVGIDQGDVSPTRGHIVVPGRNSDLVWYKDLLFQEACQSID